VRWECLRAAQLCAALLLKAGKDERKHDPSGPGRAVLDAKRVLTLSFSALRPPRWS
jgi:hypothetical protein